MLLCLSTRSFGLSWAGLDEVIDLPDDIAFEAANNVTFTLTLRRSSGDVRLRRFVMAHTHDDRPVDRRVELPVTAVIDEVFAAGQPRPSGDGADAGQFRERSLGLDAFRVVTDDDEDLGGGVDPDAELIHKLWCPFEDELFDHGGQFLDLIVQGGAVPCLVDTLTLAQNGPENARNHHAEEHLHQ